MAAWSEVLEAAPELAAAAQGRFEAYGLGLLATVRRDGAPRISGIEPLFANGELWLGMMPDSRKALDMRRDGRFALHSATTDKQLTQGDARISGWGEPVSDEQVMAQHRAAFAAATGYPPPDGPYDLFRAEVTEIMMVTADGDHLNIDSWRQGGVVKHVERR
jgi:hypothetical protein